MIVFDLHCELHAHVFEAWFRSGSDYEDQVRRGLVQCPLCGSVKVAKAPMAPSVARAGGRPESEMLSRLQSELLRNSEWVGDRFADEARAMHLGETAARAVHGQATVEQAESLLDEGVPIAPLPLPVVPPAQVN